MMRCVYVVLSFLLPSVTVLGQVPSDASSLDSSLVYAGNTPSPIDSLLLAPVLDPSIESSVVDSTVTLDVIDIPQEVASADSTFRSEEKTASVDSLRTVNAQLENQPVPEIPLIEEAPIAVKETTGPKEPHHVNFSFRVLDSVSRHPIAANVELKLIGKNYTEISKGKCNEYGKFNISMVSDAEFEVVLNAEHYYTLQRHINLQDESEEFGTIELIFNLQPLKEGATYVLENIEFKQGDYHLPRSAHEELDKLASLMKANPKMTIRLGGHTDNTGSRDASVALSLKRVNEVRYYLIRKGIKVQRIKVEGYGASKPIAHGKDPESQQKNRRVDFEILKIGH